MISPEHVYQRIARSKQLSGIELRIRSVYVKDNRTLRFWPFPGLANLYLLLFVVSDMPNQSIKPVQIITFPGVGDQESLPTAETIFYYVDDSGKETPGQLHLVASVIKSKKGLRNAGAIMESLQQDEAYNSLLQQLTGMARNALTAGAVIESIKNLSNVVGRYLGKVEDRPLATIMKSFTALSGDWDLAGTRTISIPTRNVDFHFDLTVARKEDAVA
ncbi:hypothetical protein DBR32_11180 [Taibaiella sp. KBW10]|nr:hypothetical protein DBR32_11180 [Taibaiella sp. KBW10]